MPQPIFELTLSSPVPVSLYVTIYTEQTPAGGCVLLKYEMGTKY